MPTVKAFFKAVYFALICAVFSVTCFSARASEEPVVYSFGIVPQYNVRQLRAVWQPILKEIERRTGFRFVIRGAPSIPEFEKEFLSGQFDFAYMNPYHLILANKAQGYDPLIRDVGRSLYGVLVVRADSLVKDVKELDQKSIAFPAPNALGASLLMRADMHNLHGISIQPYYVKTHNSVYLNVILGDAVAGGGVQKTLNQQPQEIRDKLKVLYQTRQVAPHPVAAHSRINSAVKEAVAEAFLALAESNDGKALLERIPIREAGIARMSDYAELQDMGLDKYYVSD